MRKSNHQIEERPHSRAVQNKQSSISSKFLVTMVALMLVSMGIGTLFSENAEAAFIQNLTNNGLPPNFVAYDTAWNEAGTMAVVVGYDSSGTPGTNAYAYYPHNDSYWPIDNKGWNQQKLHGVDYYSQPVYDFPTILVVNADYSYDGIVNFYAEVLFDVHSMRGVNAQLWQVWDYGSGTVVQGKPTAQDMAPYDLVIWVPTRDMGGWNGNGDALTIQDLQQIAQYMDGGGNFFLSNLEFSSYIPFGGPGSFTHDYLGLGGLFMTSGYEYGVRPVSMDLVFGDLPETGQNWWDYGWPGSLTKTDVVYGSLGTNCFEGYDGGWWDNTGVRYDSGTHKSLFLGFPLETVSVSYASGIIMRMLDWIEEPSPDQASDHMGNLGFVNAGIVTNSPWAQTFIPSSEQIAMAQFWMYKEAAGTDYFLIEVCADEGGVPSGSALAYGYIYSEDVPLGFSNSGWVDCIFENGGATLTPGLQYWLKCSRFNYGPAHMWGVDYDSQYSEGDAMHYSGGIWQWLSSYDFIFRTFSSVPEPVVTRSLTLYASKDTSIYNNNFDASNGAGQFISAGTTSMGLPDSIRSLIEFDVASVIPRYSTVLDASLSLFCTNYWTTDTYGIQLHPVHREWGEAGSDAPGEEYNGDVAKPGDATWQHSYYDGQFWSFTGGDYGPPSAFAWVGDVGPYSWSSREMALDVQRWANDDSLNHGWMLKGEEYSYGTWKQFCSRDNLNWEYTPRLSITYAEPRIIGYLDVFWIAGDTYGTTPPATAYKFMPSQGLELIPMNDFSTVQFFNVAIDDDGCPLFAGRGTNYIHYYDGKNWNELESNTGLLNSYSFYGLDFNPNDRRFYLTGIGSTDCAFYTDPVPLGIGSRCYKFNHFPDLSGSLDSDLAWNHLYDYGLVGGDTYLVKVWPFDAFGNGTAKYQIMDSNSQNHYYDISWDTDGWNEAGIAGNKGGNQAYWRYYHTNPQVLDGYSSTAGSAYYTCAMKPPSSPKWLFIPSGSGSIRVNIEEKDQSGEITVNVNFPHILAVDMWKQADPARGSVLNTQVEADSTYTFFVEGNYSSDGIDLWDSSAAVYIQGWYDGNNIGFASSPPDMFWSSIMYRTWQFNISYFPATGTATLNYPLNPGMISPEFAIHSVFRDTGTYGADGRSHRFYVNVTFGKQITVAPGDGIWDTGNPWDRNSLNDGQTWDLKVLLYDPMNADAYNASYAEFGVQRFAALSVSGAPTGSIPPGGSEILATPILITYSSNTPYQLNVSIPHLYKDGNPASPHIIPADHVSVRNPHADADATNSDIWEWTSFGGPDDPWCVWGVESGMYIAPPGHGTALAGPYHSDFTDAPNPYQPTPVYWQVVVPVGLPEGVYRATITITIWS